MSDLDLIEQLGDCLGRPLMEVSEEQLERHFQARYGRDGANRIDRDAYSLAKNGTVSGLLLKPVTSELLYDFPFRQLKDLRYLCLSRINLPDWSFLSQPTGLRPPMDQIMLISATARVKAMIARLHSARIVEAGSLSQLAPMEKAG